MNFKRTFSVLLLFALLVQASFAHGKKDVEEKDVDNEGYLYPYDY